MRGVRRGLGAFLVVLAACSAPPGALGPWRDAGAREIDAGLLWSYAGDGDHCDWSDVTFLFIGRSGDLPDVSAVWNGQYVRDPQDRFDQVAGEFGRNVGLPVDATFTGYATSEAELWIAPSVPDAVFVKFGDTVERWPRVVSDEPILCA